MGRQINKAKCQYAQRRAAEERRFPIRIDCAAAVNVLFFDSTLYQN